MFRQRDSLCLGETILKRSVSSKGGELESWISQRDSSSENFVEMVGNSQNLDPSNAQDRAAIKLQKVYKAFRTRRKLADSAILIEHRWRKLLDFDKLKQSSISFFDVERHETATSRWLRAKTRAARVGKGLSKNEKARKLALQYWLEAIDPRHRYGHNLHFYYVKWLNSKSREPFFYWLDIGEGKEVNLKMCPRLQLQCQCIKYLGPMERIYHEVAEVWPQSGHYQPTVRDFKGFLPFLQQNNVDQRFLCFTKSFRLFWDMTTRGCRFLIREYKILKLGQNAISFCTACIGWQGCGRLYEIAHGRAGSCTVKERHNGENNKITIEKRTVKSSMGCFVLQNSLFKRK